MDYFDRLLQRATAQARDATPPLFDPFEQEAPWPDTAAAPGGAVPHAGDVPAAPHAIAPLMPTELPSPRPPVEAAGPLAAAAWPRAPELPPPAGPIAAPLRATARVAAPQEPVPPGPRAAPGTAASALAQADRFMQSLGVPGLVMPEPASSPGARTAEPPSPAPVAASPRGLAPAATRALEPPRLLPPRAPAPPPPAAPRVAAAAAAQPARSTHDEPRARAAPPATAPAIVHTTLLVAPPSNALADLAHSAGIQRFGLGQH